MITTLTLLVLSIPPVLWIFLNLRNVTPDPTPDPDLAWIRSLRHDADLDQAVIIGNSDEFRDWRKELAA